jgi:hypothetical protein
MFIPYDLVEVLLGQDFSSRKAYLLSYPLIEDLDLLAVCRPLLEYLQVVLTMPTDGNFNPFTLQDRLGLAYYYVHPAVLNQRCASLIYPLLPDLLPSDSGKLPDAFAESLLDGLTNISTEMHADRRSRKTRVSEVTQRKTFRERYGNRIADKIILITSSVDDDFLPAFYKDL